MALAYSAADVFVMPSLQEAFGLTALEAISCGVPVAAFDAGGISDTVLHERTGLLAPVGDTTGLAAAIEKILGNRELGWRLGDEGRSHALNQFSMQRNADNYTALYRRLLGSDAA
jgi:L-malate glycosyltransferase